MDMSMKNNVKITYTTGKNNLCFIHGLLSGRRELNNKEIEARLCANGFSKVVPPFVCVYIEPVLYGTDYSIKDEMLQSLCAFIESCLNNAIVIINDSDGIQLLIYDFSEIPDFEKLHIRMMNECDLYCFIGVGSIVDTYDNIYLSALESKRMIGFKYQYSEKGIARSDSFYDFRYYSFLRADESIERVIDCFLAGNLFEMSLKINELVSWTRNQPNISNNSIRRTLVELAFRIVNIAAYAKVNVDVILGDMDIYHWIMSQNHTEMITDWILRISAVFIDIIQDNTKKTSNKAIAKACIYIDKNLESIDLSLQSISAYVGLSSSYLSSLFKSVMGEGIKAYIANKRVQRAMFLLEKTDLRVEDIAIQTGYSRVQYFTKTFKSHIGVTPSIYRQNHKSSKGQSI